MMGRNAYDIRHIRIDGFIASCMDTVDRTSTAHGPFQTEDAMIVFDTGRESPPIFLVFHLQNPIPSGARSRMPTSFEHQSLQNNQNPS